jgi:hypothetical protein
VPEGVSVRVADTRDLYAASERIARTAFGMQDELTDQQLTALFQRSDLAVSRRYLACVDGVDVATGNALFTEHGVVLNAGSTLPGWRGRGAYRALVRARWDAAVAAGTPVLVTQAGAMSRPILERLGFVAVCEVRALLDAFGEREHAT